MIVYLARCQAAASRFKAETLDTNWCPAVRGVNVPADEVHAHTTWTVRGRASMWPLADQPLFCACAVSSRWPREAFSELARAAGLKRVALRFVGGYQRKGRRGLRCAGILCFAYSHGVSVGLSDSLSGLPLHLLSWMPSAVAHMFGSCLTAVKVCKTWFLLFMRAATAARWAAQRENSFQLALRRPGRTAETCWLSFLSF